MKQSRNGYTFITSATVVLLLFAISHHGLSAERSPEVQWAEPFLVRTGQTIALRVVGRQLPQIAHVTVQQKGRRDEKITVLDWERQSQRTAQLTVKIEKNAAVGLRGLELRLADGTKLQQNVAFRVADDLRLPWPHESPNANPGQIEALRDQVFVINNFGLYQGGEDPLQNYFHDGLDIVLPMGTPVYSLADGVVRHVFLSSNVGSRSIAVEDAANPGFGWIYVHTDKFQHEEGDVVRRGDRIAEVADFNGLEHIHLSRTFVPANEQWSQITSHHNLFADDYFELRDSERPLIKPRLYLFKNDSNEVVPREDGGALVATGDVDIVIGIRDPGHYARAKDPAFPIGFGDRLAPAIVRCEILNSRGEQVAQWTRDLTRTVLRWQESQREIWAPDRVAVVFKPPAFVPGNEPGGLSHSYYILTNSAQINPAGEIKPSDSEKSWRTAATNRKGARVFPDGNYTVRVTAWDSSGNRASRRFPVEVRN